MGGSRHSGKEGSALRNWSSLQRHNNTKSLAGMSSLLFATRASDRASDEIIVRLAKFV
jgi:hypothetical protein